MGESFEYISDEVQDCICELTDSYFESRGLCADEEENLSIEAFMQAERGYIYLIHHRGKAIGCVLHYNMDVVVSRYFDDGGVTGESTIQG